MTEEEKFSKIVERVKYDPSTGIFVWSEMCSSRGRAKTGSEIKSKHKSGYSMTSFSIGGRRNSIRMHRLAWYIHYGKCPENFIDHINGDRSDNRIENLRDVKHTINARNQKRNKKNTSGFSGVTRFRGKWAARYKIEGVSHYVGSFNIPEEAYSQLLIERAKHGYTEDHGT